MNDVSWAVGVPKWVGVQGECCVDSAPDGARRKRQAGTNPLIGRA